MKPRLHLFVCRNERPSGGRPACGQRGSGIVAALQRELAARPDRWSEVRITESGCLGPCFDGPTVVAYPDGTWYAGVTADDAGALLDHHLDGAPALKHRLLELADDGDHDDAPDADADPDEEGDRRDGS